MNKDHENQPTASGTDTVPPPSDRDPTRGHKGFREPLGENSIEQLRRYQVITIPPSARRALLGAELPGASPELLYDTLPPHLGVRHEGTDAPLQLEHPPAISSARRRVARAIALGFAATILALSLLILVRWAGSSPSSAASSANGGDESAAEPRALPRSARAELIPATEGAKPAGRTAPEPSAPPPQLVSPEKKSATARPTVPMKEPSRLSAPALAGISPAGTGSVRAPAADSARPKSMRLGSR
jgi:hypothetical protein